MKNNNFSITVNVVDIPNRKIFPAVVTVSSGRVASILPCDTGDATDEATRDAIGDANNAIGDATDEAPTTFLLPGFVDSHVHVESSMLVPSEFARAAVVHGTVATVSDPHEIGNVLGTSGVRYMQENAAQVPFKFYFGAPSCVPATTFESAGAEITVEEVEQLLDDPRIVYLSEMMNFPGVLNGDPQVMAKIAAAKKRNKPVDGHAPGLRGAEAAAYIAAGISTDHECFTKDEALDKIAAGALIAIREGSAARNFDALYTLIDEFPNAVMLCSDDKHPDEMLLGHINALARRAVASGMDLFNTLQTACINPVKHYNLEVGLLQEGDPADFIEVDSLESFNVLRTWINGQLVAERGETTIARIEPEVVNQYVAQEIEETDISVLVEGCANDTLESVSVASENKSTQPVQVIRALDGQLITERFTADVPVCDGAVQSDVAADVLKLVVVNRYAKAKPAVAFIHGFGFARGAMASSVAHDSHNVIAVGTNDADLCRAVNLVMQNSGGLSAVDGTQQETLALPVAGLMATGTCREVGEAYSKLDAMVKGFGSKLRSPYMTLSFMALLVIPELKLSDLGLFDGAKFEFTPLLGNTHSPT